ncbi:thiol-disulfide oxidoreductase DCC family protein [Chitinibacteraceae bacterium HSL-7]
MTRYTLYYDRACPLCRAEIHRLKQLDRYDVLELVDASAAGFIAPAGVSVAELMARLHARDAAGNWLVGIDAIAAIYRAVGRGRIWSHLLLWRPLRPLMTRVYLLIAGHRQRISGWLGLHRARCEDGVCSRDFL